MALNLFGKKFRCEACGAKFKTQAELDEHAKVHQASISAPVQTETSEAQEVAMFECETCGQQFKTKQELDDHMKTHSAQ